VSIGLSGPTVNVEQLLCRPTVAVPGIGSIPSPSITLPAAWRNRLPFGRPQKCSRTPPKMEMGAAGLGRGGTALCHCDH
jgi:hypothetical protein